MVWIESTKSIWKRLKHSDDILKRIIRKTENECFDLCRASLSFWQVHIHNMNFSNMLSRLSYSLFALEEFVSCFSGREESSDSTTNSNSLSSPFVRFRYDNMNRCNKTLAFPILKQYFTKLSFNFIIYSNEKSLSVYVYLLFTDYYYYYLLFILFHGKKRNIDDYWI